MNRTLLFSALVLALCAFICRAAQRSLPEPEQVIRRVLERSAAVAKLGPTNQWTYDKKTFLEEFASNGSVESAVERLYRVKVIKGVPFSRLLKVGGKDFNASELAKEDKREAEFRKRVSGRDAESVTEGKEPLIPADLAARFTYQVVRRDNLCNRPALLLTFTPKLPLAPQKSFQDRILNRLEGRFWVDELTGEVASLDVRLTEGFALGFLGMPGALRSFEMHLARTPMSDGSWVPNSWTSATLRVCYSLPSRGTFAKSPATTAWSHSNEVMHLRICFESVSGDQKSKVQVPPFRYPASEGCWIWVILACCQSNPISVGGLSKEQIPSNRCRAML